MKKTSILVLSFLLLLCSNIYAQYGYKEYTWGMTTEEVRAKCADLKLFPSSSWPSPTRVLLYFYSSEISSTIPNPLQYEKGKIEIYNSNSKSLDFYFVDGKLRAVSMMFFGEDIYSSLVQKYGKVYSVSGSQGNYRYETASWKDKGRIIIWEQEQSLYFETVQYIDSQWLNPLIDKAMSDYRGKKNQTKSKLD
jgi:hypothetical protein